MVDRAGSWLFGNGFGCIVPYVALYLAGRALDLPPARLLGPFLALHAVTLVLFAAWAVPRLRRASLAMAGFWIALGLLFLLPGAYLEFPSDPWEHVGRIYGWNSVTRIGQHDAANKFAYFWGWTWLRRVPVEWRPAALAVYGAFWELLLAVQFYRLARRLGFSPGWSAVQVAGTVALFGTNLFAFYRYYALSSTPLAYVAYLFGLGAVLGREGRRPGTLVIALGLAAVVAWANHAQELVFLAMVIPAVLAFDGIRRLSPAWQRRMIALGAAGFLGALAVGIWLRGAHPGLYLGKDAGISALGVYRLWDPGTSFFETLAVPGWLGVVAACAIARTRPRLAFLTLLPPALVLFPPFVLLAARVLPDDYVIYRLLYAFAPSLALIAAVEACTRPGARRVAVAVALAGVSLIPAWPVRGRLYFQLYVPPAANRLVHLYPVAVQLMRHASFANDCMMASDRVTNFFLNVHFGFGLRGGRFGSFDLLGAWAASPSLDVLPFPGLWPLPVCAGVLLDPREVPASPGSLIARGSRHWSERQSDHRAYLSAHTATLRERVRAAGWRPIGSAAWINPTAVASGRAVPRQPAADPQR